MAQQGVHNQSTDNQAHSEGDFYHDIVSLQIPHATVSVRSDIGDMKYMVTIRDNEDGFELKIQIENTSSREPIILLKHQEYSADDLLGVCDTMKTFLRGIPIYSGGHLLRQMHEYVKNHLKNLAPKTTQTKGSHNQKNKGKAGNKNRGKGNEKSAKSGSVKPQKEEKPSKLPSMKTATDVIHRILWDSNIPQDQITIGYVDRFIGILEKPFSAFSWEDIASVDYFTFAIPKHRIAYFKYRQAIVWHKEKRLDRVFNSLGNAETIDQVIANYEEDMERQHARQVQSDTSSTVHGFSDEDEGDFDDDDDGIQVVLDNPSGGNYDGASDDDNYTEDPHHGHSHNHQPPREYWTDKLRPNFFVCVRVTNPEIQRMASHVQEMICERDSRYDSCCCPPEMLHITLCTLRLHDAEQVAECLQVLRTARPDLEQSLPRTPLHLRGVDKFFGRVLYAKVHADQSFFDFVSHLNMELRAAGMAVVDSHDFVPHMSILKVNRPTARILGSKYIGEFLYAGAENVDFGEQSIDSVYLCSMEKNRGPDGFYITPGTLTFVREIVSSDTNTTKD